MRIAFFAAAWQTPASSIGTRHMKQWLQDLNVFTIYFSLCFGKPSLLHAVAVKLKLY